MADVKLGNKIFNGVSAVKMNTTDGGTIIYKNSLLQEKATTENGEIVPDEGYDGLSKVTVNVSGYITVASVDELPTDAEDGTLAVIEG